jgi:hypothetical protein
MASMKMAVLWDVAPRSLVEIDRRFRGAYCLHHQGDSYPAYEMLHRSLDLAGSCERGSETFVAYKAGNLMTC